MASFLGETRKASLWVQQHVMKTLDVWNCTHAPALASELGIAVPRIESDAFLAFVGKGQPSLQHLAEIIHKTMLPLMHERVLLLLENSRFEDLDEEQKRLVERMDALTPTVIHNTWLRPDRNPDLPSPDVPYLDGDNDDRPEILCLSVHQLLERLHSIRSGYRITLQLAGLSVEDVLEILWDGQGIVTHLELFNVKEWHDGNLTQLKQINEVQNAINHGDVMQL